MADPLYMAYHDDEWGTPLHDESALFENLVLDGAQAGLSWIMILKKRRPTGARSKSSTRKDRPLGPRQKEARLLDAGIVRNRVKIEATVARARLPRPRR